LTGVDRSNLHSPRVDEQLEHEVSGMVTGTSDEGRTSGRSHESPGEEEPGLGHRPEVDEPTGWGPGEDVLEWRERIAVAIAPADFPATSEDLVAAASEANAAPDVMAALTDLPSGWRYEAVGEVLDALGAGTAEHGG
jgi:hypothetical protein